MSKILLVLPVYNEERILESSTKILDGYMKTIERDYKIVIANNASTDKTKEIADRLSKEYKNVEAIHLKIKGRGNALKEAWKKYDSSVYAYCDVDLATDINHLEQLFHEVLNGNDIVIGNRYMKGSKARRNLKRLILSKGYTLLIKIFFNTKITDFQCGFKAMNKSIVKEMVPNIIDDGWFFDSELVLIAEKNKYNIKQLPVKWNENKESKVNIIKTAYYDICGLVRLKNGKYIKTL